MRTPRNGRLPWGRALGALVAVIIVIVVLRGMLEILLVAAILALLVGSYLLRHYSRRTSVYDRPDDGPSEQ